MNGIYELILDITRAFMSSGDVVKLLVRMENALASSSPNP